MKRRDIQLQGIPSSLQAFEHSLQIGSEPWIDSLEWLSSLEGRPKKERTSRGLPGFNADFRCAICGQWVTSDARRSGVQNRNHCPHCLASRHLDLNQAGDRLSACKGVMRPIGLTLKQTRKKYAERSAAGEIMLAHACQECGKISINRIAADDDVETLMHVFRSSTELQLEFITTLAEQDVHLLIATDVALVRRRLYGA